jgi:outer membrane protein assembly factor BamB
MKVLAVGLLLAMVFVSTINPLIFAKNNITSHSQLESCDLNPTETTYDSLDVRKPVVRVDDPANEYRGIQASENIPMNTSWPMFHYDTHRIGVTKGTAPETNHLLWSSPAGDWLESSPAVADGKVFIGSEDKKVYCFDASTGEQLWTYPTSQLIVCSPAVADGKVIIGSNNNVVYCLDENTGECLWYYGTGWGITQSSPAIANGRVYIGSQDDKVYCLDENNGSRLWSYTTNYDLSSSPAVVSDRMYIGSMAGMVYCLNAITGELIWNHNIYYAIWVSSPTIYNSRLYIGALDFKLYCLDAINGTQLWNFSTGDFITGTPAAYEGKIYFGSWDNHLYCLDAITGMTQWTFLTNGPVTGSAAICDGKIYFGSGDNNVYCLDVETGEEIWRYTTGDQVHSSPAIANGNVYVGSFDTNVYCFGGENQNPYANFTWTPTTPSSGHIVTFDASSSYDPDGVIIRYQWDWDNDGIYENVSTHPTMTHTWENPGEYPVNLQVTDNENGVGGITKTIVVQNHPPDTPVIQGPMKGNIKEMYNYTLRSTDPDNDTVFYDIDWGDGTSTGWIGPYASGETIIQSHTWTQEGTYIIKAKAKDTHGNESDWGVLSVTMPYSYKLPLLERLLERFPHAFPILRHLFGF